VQLPLVTLDGFFYSFKNTEASAYETRRDAGRTPTKGEKTKGKTKGKSKGKTKGGSKARIPLLSASVGVLMLVYPYFGARGGLHGVQLDTIKKKTVTLF